ncbi:MAG: hypothetical protein CM1200mP24_05850 [Gammaproteobacteria bacterium]|nr:MAG: hypothetical protein CM1200mP24_05850 [Gammaproteobacteria bacterium]
MVVLGLGMGLSGPGLMAGASLAVTAEEQGAVAGIAGAWGPLGFFFRNVNWRGLVSNRSDAALHYCSGRIPGIVSLYASCFHLLGDTVTDV